MNDHPDDMAPINGLVDARRAAAMLGVSVNVFKVWANRSQEGKGGVAAAMPKPVAKMHGQIYLAAEIEEFGRLLAMSRRPPRTRERGLGAYFTPESAAQMMVSWAVRGSQDVILEPSVGDGRFAHAVHALAAANHWKSLQLHGCELDPQTAAQAVASGAVSANLLHVGDFLAEDRIPQVDAVIGNPPYVRLRELDASLRKNAVAAASDALGEAIDPAGSVWMPFVVKATKHLKADGRLALVLPLDFTYVRYARPLWDYLARLFGRLRIVRFRERVFPDILQNVLILLAEDKGKNTDYVELIARERLADLDNNLDQDGIRIPIESVIRGERIFQYALLPDETRSALALLAPYASPALNRVKFNIGYVSGNKTYFHPSDEVVREFKLPSRSLVPTAASSRSFSRQPLRTSQMDASAHLWLPRGKLTKGEHSYITRGEQDGVDMGFKCRIRKPWYVVPGVKTPDVFLTTFSDLPRLHLNDSDWTASNSVLGGFLRPDNDVEGFVDSWYTPLTLLSAEIEIHSLGGGVMVAVPREADSVLMLKSEFTSRANRRQLDAALRAGKIEDAYAIGSKSIAKLIGHDGASTLDKGIETLIAWRKAQVTPA
ncbi:N-6 DNA methylase [Luteimonas sp. TWI1437]|uniref:N-6 DNA methylase n=1 Tax=unclassified Luteimonas TaxID=2629088 RepID=UPI003207D2D1